MDNLNRHSCFLFFSVLIPLFFVFFDIQKGFPVPPPYYPHQPYPMSQFVPTPTDSTSEANSECSRFEKEACWNKHLLTVVFWSSSNGGLLCTKKLTESVRKLCEATFSNAGLSRVRDTASALPLTFKSTDFHFLKNITSHMCLERLLVLQLSIENLATENFSSFLLFFLIFRG